MPYFICVIKSEDLEHHKKLLRPNYSNAEATIGESVAEWYIKDVLQRAYKKIDTYPNYYCGLGNDYSNNFLEIVKYDSKEWNEFFKERGNTNEYFS